VWSEGYQRWKTSYHLRKKSRGNIPKIQKNKPSERLSAVGTLCAGMISHIQQHYAESENNK
jgi:hypothetical protein